MSLLTPTSTSWTSLAPTLGAEVDLVMVEAVKNRYIAADIERTKQVIYAA
jgi:hypothetical protein